MMPSQRACDAENQARTHIVKWTAEGAVKWETPKVFCDVRQA